MAARFILYQFAKAMSRTWMLKQWRLFAKVMRILARHYGYLFVVELILNKLILNKNLEWKKVSGFPTVS